MTVPIRPLAPPLTICAAVIGAIILRDIRSRAGPYYTGFLMFLLMPLAHLLCVVVIYHVMGRIAPEGTNEVVYFGLSILPFVIFLYMSRQIVIGAVQNGPLLFFNRVKIFDIIVARALLEAGGAVVIFVFLAGILAVYSHEFSPRDWPGLIFAVAGTIYLSFAFAVPNALIAHVIPIWLFFYSLSAPVLWAASGIFFFPTAIPEPYNHWLALNPLLQCVEWIRYAYYEDYPDKLLNIPYLLTFATICLALSLLAERISRKVRLSA